MRLSSVTIDEHTLQEFCRQNNVSKLSVFGSFARGEDRLGERHTIGLSTTAFKVLTNDTGGGLFVMEHESRNKGGPPRHLHHNEDE